MTKRPRKKPTTAASGDALRILSWNVNGLRSAETKGFYDWLASSGADVVGLQETRIPTALLSDAQRSPGAYRGAFRDAEKPGYSGVALYSRAPEDALVTTFGDPVLDSEGRLIAARFGELLIVNGYFPNGSGKDRDNSRVPYKLDFYRRLFDWLEPQRREGRPIVVMGDFNTAHRPIDLARPKANEKTSGFLPEEREELDRWLVSGFTDAFRHVHGDVPDRYSWWSQRFGVREKNIGWRIDYTLLSEAALPHVRGAGIDHDVRGSDHCPVWVELDRAVVGSKR